MDEKKNNLSVDDILKEIDVKKTGQPEQDIAVTNSSGKPAFSDDEDSLTAEIASIERKRFGVKKPTKAQAAELKAQQEAVDLSVTQIISESKQKSEEKQAQAQQPAKLHCYQIVQGRA